MAQRFTVWALDEEVPGWILGETYLGSKPLYIGSGLGGRGIVSVTMELIGMVVWHNIVIISLVFYLSWVNDTHLPASGTSADVISLVGPYRPARSHSRYKSVSSYTPVG